MKYGQFLIDNQRKRLTQQSKALAKLYTLFRLSFVLYSERKAISEEFPLYYCMNILKECSRRILTNRATNDHLVSWRTELEVLQRLSQ